MNRRDFARLLAIGGAAPFITPEVAWARGAPCGQTSADPGVTG